MRETCPELIGKKLVIETDLGHIEMPYHVAGCKHFLHVSDIELTTKMVPDDDEKWYYKGGGIDKGRYHMSEHLKLPTQGYWGKLVEHEDMETSLGDWQKEFKPQTGEDPGRAICAKHPDNEWCQEHYPITTYAHAYRSSSRPVNMCHAVLVSAVILALAVGSQ